MEQKVRVYLVVLIVLIIFVCSCEDRIFDNPFDPNAEEVVFEVVNTIYTPAYYPQGLCWDGNTLWNVDGYYDILYSLNRLSGAQVRSLSSPLPSTSGVAYDGENLWVCSESSTYVYRINLLNGDIQRMLHLQKGFFSAVEYALGSLWLADILSNKIIEADPETGEILSSFSNPGFSLDGLAFDGNHFWVSDSSTMTIYQLDIDGKVLRQFLAPGQSPRGLTYDGHYLWNADGNQKIYQLEFKD